MIFDLLNKKLFFWRRRKFLQVGQRAYLLHISQEHEDYRERINSLGVVRKPLLIPVLEQDAEMLELWTQLCVNSNQTRVVDLEDLVHAKIYVHIVHSVMSGEKVDSGGWE